MKRRLFWLVVLFNFVPFFIRAQCPDIENRISNEVITDLNLSIDQFYQELLKLQGLVEADQAGSKLKSQFLSCRLAYKQFEFFVGYQNNNMLREFNGPNLITNINNFTYSENKNPHGLQLMEELVYEFEEQNKDFFIAEIERTKILTSKLGEKFDQKQETGHNFHVVIWDALRVEMIRIEALGITGFDTPICKNALPEAKIALEKIESIVHIYKELFYCKDNRKLFSRGKKLFENGIEMLNCDRCDSTGFDDFNRMQFITEVLHPISVWLKTATFQLGFQFPSDLSPISKKADHIYAVNALNKDYFNSGSTPERIELGKRLFNDQRLSGNGERSCASCHIAEKGMADGLTQNFAFNGQPLRRHTPTLWNSVYQSSQFWDSRVSTLEKQAMSVIHHPDEMGGNLDQFLEYLRSNVEYIALFDAAYKGYLSKHNVVHAINCFVASLKSFDSKFDRYMRGDPTALNETEINGFNLFMGKAQCATCHFPPLFNGLVPPFYTESEAEIIGVPVSMELLHIIDPDSGKYLATGLDIHLFAFKTPGIRNIALTPPYMHNGVFKDLPALMDFYNKGGGQGNGMDLPTQTLSDQPLHLSVKEVNEIIAFMNSLTSE